MSGIAIKSVLKRRLMAEARPADPTPVDKSIKFPNKSHFFLAIFGYFRYIFGIKTKIPKRGEGGRKYYGIIYDQYFLPSSFNTKGQSDKGSRKKNFEPLVHF